VFGANSQIRKRPRQESKHKKALTCTGCPIHLALEVLGDRWTLPIVRDLLFKGLHSYKSLLGAGEDIATNILSDRLQRLQAFGLIEKYSNPLDARQYEYHLTEAGFALAPTLIDLVL
jgi:DNA-binding HxlR family transcriptional regulator